jgi:hypothetical protein
MAEKTYTEAQMRAAIKSAWSSGIEWATCYISWFTPSAQDTGRKYGAAVTAAMKAAQHCVHADESGAGSAKQVIFTPENSSVIKSGSRRSRR